MPKAVRFVALPIALFALSAPAPEASRSAEPRCFGAAARDPVERCQNPSLERRVVPTPAQALRLPNAPCRFPRRSYPLVCEFGAREEGASRRVALIGDSHAAHWRAALAPVARNRGWAGFSLTRAGCPLSTTTPILRDDLTPRCLSWRVAVMEWLREHPGVDTLFVSQHRVRIHGSYEEEVQGFIRAWSDLPDSIRRIVVIRDTPRRPEGTRRCVRAAIARGRAAGQVCAVRRSRVLPRDPAADAANRIRSRRVRLVDMTRYFCDASRCFPVIGGALVHKDSTHMTARFGATLAPFLERRLVGLGLG